MKVKPLIWVEGIIGAGKSSLGKRLAEELNFRLMEEPVEENPFLEKFYDDPKRILSDLDRYRKVTSKDIKRVAAEYVNENWLFYEMVPASKLDANKTEPAAEAKAEEKAAK